MLQWTAKPTKRPGFKRGTKACCMPARAHDECQAVVVCRHATTSAPPDADSDNNDDNKSTKSDEDNDEEAKEGSHGPEGSTPEPEGADARTHTDKRQEEEQQHKLKHKTRQDRDAEFEARIAELTLRSEPVGLDRLHRKYWVLTGVPTLFIKSTCQGEGFYMGRGWVRRPGFVCGGEGVLNNVT